MSTISQIQQKGKAPLLQKTERILNHIPESMKENEIMPKITLPKMREGEIFGPHRILPGRLSVSRALGDAHAKVNKLGGNPNVLISSPDIKEFEIGHMHDFIIIGSDGLYDKMTNSELVVNTWRAAV